jgi:prepilin-type N-terminal cleavage/methylation domain-containing protein
MTTVRFFRASLRGFTLIELMVALVIMITMTVILLADYPNSIMRTTLANSANTLTLLVKEAQVRGSAIDSINSSVGGYGVYISRTGTKQDAILFADTVDLNLTRNSGITIGDGLYDNAVDIKKHTQHLLDRYSFEKLCIYDDDTSLFKCNAAVTPAITSLTISFTRPSPIAHIYVNNATTTDYSMACVQLYSPLSPTPGHVRSVVVYHSGMVIPQGTSCD